MWANRGRPQLCFSVTVALERLPSPARRRSAPTPTHPFSPPPAERKHGRPTADERDLLVPSVSGCRHYSGAAHRHPTDNKRTTHLQTPFSVVPSVEPLQSPLLLLPWAIDVCDVVEWTTSRPSSLSPSSTTDAQLSS